MKIEGVRVTLSLEDPVEIINAMDGYEKIEFMQSLSCKDDVIEYVFQQVFDGQTDGGYHGSISCTWNGNSALQIFRRKLIDIGADNASKARIKELERYLVRRDAQIKALHEELAKARGEK